MSTRPRVFTLEPGQGALARLIDALMSGALLGIDFSHKPDRLADLIVHVPNKRVKATFEAALVTHLGPRPVILPRILPLGVPGDALEALEAEDVEALSLETRVMSPLERRFHLLPLVAAWRARLDIEAQSPTVSLRETLALSGALGTLIDEMTLVGQPLARLASTAPEGYDPARFDAYWNQSRAFLRIAADHWPEALRELGAQDAAAARLAALERAATALDRQAPDTPMLVLGSTGSVAATGKLMKAVSRLPHGAVVLPGLDTELDEAAFALIGGAAKGISPATRFGHPQAMLKRTLADIGIQRTDVGVLRVGETASPRWQALSDMLRPAETVACWKESLKTLDVAAAFDGIRVIEAANEQEEALAIALAMRETLDTPGKRVVLVTPDRALARRVAIELTRWGIAAQDAAGSTLRESPAGTFLQLLLAAANEEPGALMALLGHPLARFGFSQRALERLAEALDVAVLRGHRFLSGEALATRVAHGASTVSRYSHPAVLRLAPEALGRLPELAKVLDDLLAPFRPDGEARALPEFAVWLADALEAASRDERGVSHFAASPDGGAVLLLLAEIARQSDAAQHPPEALPGALALLLSEQPLPPSGEEHPRALLLGPFEARLIEADRIILSALNENRFPPAAPEDPFLNRAMRDDLGLPAPEWRIGASAHDFAQLAANPDLILTRAKRSGTSPALPSRFLRRLEAYAGTECWKAMVERGTAYLDLARALDATADAPPAVPRPAPVPAAPRLPEKLSITEIETLRRNPFAIYARHILRLVPLDAPDEEPDARDRGTLLHEVLERYAASAPPEDPALARAHLDEIARDVLGRVAGEPEFYHFWLHRLGLIAPGFIAHDRAVRAAGHQIHVEVRANLALDLPGGTPFRLTGLADRIEVDTDGRWRIIDYKSGQIPSDSVIEAGLGPQLPISAALATRGGFGQKATVSEIAYAPIGGNAPFTLEPVQTEDVAALAQANWDRLIEELTALAAGAAGYEAQKQPKTGHAEDYDHLARRALWEEDGPSETGEDE